MYIISKYIYRFYHYPFECEQTNTTPREKRLEVECPKLLILLIEFYFFGQYIMSFNTVSVPADTGTQSDTLNICTLS